MAINNKDHLFSSFPLCCYSIQAHPLGYNVKKIALVARGFIPALFEITFNDVRQYLGLNYWLLVCKTDTEPQSEIFDLGYSCQGK